MYRLSPYRNPATVRVRPAQVFFIFTLKNTIFSWSMNIIWLIFCPVGVVCLLSTLWPDITSYTDNFLYITKLYYPHLLYLCQTVLSSRWWCDPVVHPEHFLPLQMLFLPNILLDPSKTNFHLFHLSNFYNFLNLLSIFPSKVINWCKIARVTNRNPACFIGTRFHLANEE